MKSQPTGFLSLALAVVVLFFHLLSARSDTVYVWSSDGTIQKINTNGVGSLFTTNNLSGWNGPVGLALDNVGNLYAGVPSESHIWRFSPAGTGSLNGYIDSISGLAFDNAGNLFATIPNYIEILKLDYGQGYGYYFGASTNYTQSHLSYPINLAFDSADNIYVVNNTNASPDFFPWPPSPYDNTIEKFSTNFTWLGTFATNLNNPSGLAFDKTGNLFVSNSRDNRIYKFTPNGVRFIFAFAGLNKPQGLAFDSSGNLYVANSGTGTIQKFTPDGVGSLFASGLISPSSIAIFPGLKLWSATAITLDHPKILPSGAFQFDFIDNAGLAFTVLRTTNVSLSLTNWTALGSVTEVSPGQYQFTDPNAMNSPQRFYRIRSD